VALEATMTGAVTRADYDQMAGRYDDGRAFPLDQIDGWRRAVVGLMPTRSAPLADVGSGTGIWSHAFARWFGIRIVGVEPSRADDKPGRGKGWPDPPDVGPPVAAARCPAWLCEGGS
jgi:ubiquinone/menaquinone biosynthesis C-methylase UbiE